jgi:hypothetical protein
VNINFLPFLIVWAALAVTVVILFLYHRTIARQEDAHLDVLETAAVAQQQVALDHKLEVVDKWGKILTAVVVVYGVILAGLYLVQSWQQMSKIGV